MLIAKVRGPAIAVRAHADRGPHGEIRIDHPVDATALRIERVNLSRHASNKNAPAHHGRLCICLIRARISKCPFQFQPRDLRGAQPSHLRRLESVLRRIHAPTVPMRLVGARTKRRATLQAEVGVYWTLGFQLIQF